MFRTAGLAFCLSALSCGAMAQTAATAPAPADPVVAKVNGQPIYLSDLKGAAQGLPENVRSVPPQTLYPMLLDQLIDGRALHLDLARHGDLSSLLPCVRKTTKREGPSSLNPPAARARHHAAGARRCLTARVQNDRRL